MTALPEPTGAFSQPTATQPTAPALDPGLTNREIEVLQHWLKSDSKPVVSAQLGISIGTVNTQLTRIRGKYAAIERSAPTKTSLLARALQDGIIDLDEL
ncbi:helix-turn-helix transcriptional regulator [Rhodococcus sp. ARC_M6]|uniref:helix-turn-helix transcriptional regulator n=1 Tax=Rhodococcus sp. ARC_M6 TaxID=2928852 RepID=UPI0035AE6173